MILDAIHKVYPVIKVIITLVIGYIMFGLTDILLTQWHVFSLSIVLPALISGLIIGLLSAILFPRLQTLVVIGLLLVVPLLSWYVMGVHSFVQTGELVNNHWIYNKPVSNFRSLVQTLIISVIAGITGRYLWKLRRK